MGWMYVAGAVVSSLISGYFGDRAAKRQEVKQRESEQNRIYMAALQRKWQLQDRRYAQDQFHSFAQYASPETRANVQRGQVINPDSITPINPYGSGSSAGGVAPIRGGIGMDAPPDVPRQPQPAAPPPVDDGGKALRAPTMAQVQAPANEEYDFQPSGPSAKSVGGTGGGGGTATPGAKSYTGMGSTGYGGGGGWAGSGNSNPASGYGYSGTNWGASSPNAQGPTATSSAAMSVAGAVITSVISGYFSDRASSRQAALQGQSAQNSTYQLELERQWTLQNRRFTQDGFHNFAQFATNPNQPRGTPVDPDSIQPVDPFTPKPKAPVTAAARPTPASQQVKPKATIAQQSRNATGKIGGVGVVPRAVNDPTPWRSYA